MAFNLASTTRTERAEPAETLVTITHGDGPRGSEAIGDGVPCACPARCAAPFPSSGAHGGPSRGAARTVPTALEPVNLDAPWADSDVLELVLVEGWHAAASASWIDGADARVDAALDIFHAHWQRELVRKRRGAQRRRMRHAFRATPW